MPSLLRSCVTALLLLAVPSTALAAFETRARAAYVVDQTTGTILMTKNAQESLPPASMSKLMTLNMLFEALRDGRVTLDTRFSVSPRAKAMGGSSMFLNTTDRPTVEELIKGIIVQSGNDACVTVAEGLAGTEDGFARLMNERGKAIGLKNSTFANASGWPNPNHRMSMEDLGILAVRLITEFPEYYGYFGLTEFPYDGRVPNNHLNRNPLLRLGIGADGLKTGHTNEAGYGLVGSAVQGNRRIVFVITGLESEVDRAQEAERIANWAFRQFVQKTVATKGTRMAEAPVWMGADTRVGLVVPDDLSVLMPAVGAAAMSAEITYESPIKAPITAGDQLATMTITLPELEPLTVPLVAENDVTAGGFLPRLRTATRVLLRQISGAAAQL
ncbi:D-alanyl-D-alanine carboxypeptidase [Alphaproteobacteria bacterium KMM 3653]|uniref:serine-type D-Ala-D-Ala carboxypeptidase n=1 Tax=Harenicola maris TaxID=2841044 RepID=A0AAP2CQZ5_9RHOB|nr:D-alanyl-D-alanine carboxypeptidase [Harenicola maris]